MISDEAVEAAARVLCRKAHIDKYGTDAWRDGELDTRVDQYWPCWSTEVRAALEAALPHLLASQGCGTGHSADAGSLPALADKTELALCAYWLDECARYFEKRPTNGEDAAHWSNVANAENARKYAALLRAIKEGADG